MEFECKREREEAFREKSWENYVLWCFGVYESILKWGACWGLRLEVGAFYYLKSEPANKECLKGGRGVL